MAKSKLRQLVRFPWAADSCPWVGKLRTVLPLNDRVIRDSAVPLGLTINVVQVVLDTGGSEARRVRTQVHCKLSLLVENKKESKMVLFINYK
jgi:hypothetical protein